MIWEISKIISLKIFNWGQETLTQYSIINRTKTIIWHVSKVTRQNPDFIEKDSSQINDFDGVDLLPPDYVTDTELKRVNQDFIINSHGKNWRCYVWDIYCA
jgi:hypothetical protein